MTPFLILGATLDPKFKATIWVHQYTYLGSLVPRTTGSGSIFPPATTDVHDTTTGNIYHHRWTMAACIQHVHQRVHGTLSHRGTIHIHILLYYVPHHKGVRRTIPPHPHPRAVSALACRQMETCHGRGSWGHELVSGTQTATTDFLGLPPTVRIRRQSLHTMPQMEQHWTMPLHKLPLQAHM